MTKSMSALIRTQAAYTIFFWVRSNEDIDAIYNFVKTELNPNFIHGPEEGPDFAPGYYSILFEDPDGIRVEFNYVPGKGHFGDKGRLGDEGPGPSDVFSDQGI